MCEQSKEFLIPRTPDLLIMDKHRSGERRVSIIAAENSPLPLEAVKGREIVIIDDMVRTGSTVVECCKRLKEAGAIRIIFVVTHFYSSPEVKENLNDMAVHEITTTITLPTPLNRDMQGRLRRKILILKIERWIAHTLKDKIFHLPVPEHERLYSVDMSRKNPRWRESLEMDD